jgi:hypothetical protein
MRTILIDGYPAVLVKDSVALNDFGNFLAAESPWSDSCRACPRRYRVKSKETCVDRPCGEYYALYAIDAELYPLFQIFKSQYEEG